MSNASTKKVFIQIESAAEQQKNYKNQRKTLKVLQGIATDKENLTGRPQLDKLSRLKASAESTLSASTDYAKRKKTESRAAETQTSPDKSQAEAKKITADDLTGDAKPSEHYWERLAEKRLEALEQSLDENQRLYERIDGLEEELNTSRKQLEEAQHLVTVLTEMLQETEEEQEIEKDEDDTEVEQAEQELSDNDSESNSSDDDATPTKQE